MIRPNEKFSFDSKGLWRKLKIKDVEPLDAAVFSCETLHDNTGVRVTVSEPVVTVITGLTDQECIEGGTVSFQLQLSQCLRPQVKIILFFIRDFQLPRRWMVSVKTLDHEIDFWVSYESSQRPPVSVSNI